MLRELTSLADLDIAFTVPGEHPWLDIPLDTPARSYAVTSRDPKGEPTLWTGVDEWEFWSHHIARSIFLMPPSQRPEQPHHDEWTAGMTRRARWTESLPHLPLALDDYSEYGAILYFAEGEATARSLPYTADARRSFIDECRDHGVPLSDAIKRLHKKGLLAATLSELETRSQSVKR